MNASIRSLAAGAWLLGGCAMQLEVGDAAYVPADARTTRTDATPGTNTDAAVDVRYRDVPNVPDPFAEDACSNPPPAVRMYECDPLVPTAGCPAGQGCYPWVEYPPDRCAAAIYHAQCFPAGDVPLMGACGADGRTCGPGLTCFGSSQGNRCLSLCRFDGAGPMCPAGQLCEPTDLPDFGACD